MKIRNLFLISLLATSLCAADKKPKEAIEAVKSYDQPQPSTEELDLTMYQRIRYEGLQHSHIMDYASALMDGIGPRLTASPNAKRANEWTRDQFTSMGCSNAHLEDWGEFGMGWRQLNTWVRMTAPDTAVFIAQAGPWSPSSHGPINGRAVWMMTVKEEKDLDQYKGKLAGKIVFLGDMREVKPVDKPLFTRYDDASLKAETEFPVDVERKEERDFVKRVALREKTFAFIATEHAIGIILPSRGREGGSGGTIFDDNGTENSWFFYTREHAQPLPVAVTAIENYGRVYRLLKANVPVTMEMNIDTEFTGDHEHAFNTIAEIPGTDPKLKDEIVMLGGHLDSWAAATGATDNGAGTVVTMEAMRILNALHVQPRRTIRAALWTGEEQGDYGSHAYVKEHFGYVPTSTAPEEQALPEFLRKPGGPPELKPGQQKVSAYFNVDNGSGKIRGIYAQQNAEIAPIFRQWIEPLKDLGVTTVTMRDTGQTDHEEFDNIGIPGFQFIQDDLDYDTRSHHSNMDTYERLQPNDLAQAAVVEAIFVYNAAMRDQMLPRKPLPHPELDEQRKAPLKNVMPGAEPREEKKE